MSKLNNPKNFKNVFKQNAVQPSHVWAEWLSQMTGLKFIDNGTDSNDLTESIWNEKYQIKILVPNSAVANWDQEMYSHFTIVCDYYLVTSVMEEYFVMLRINNRVHLLREVLSLVNMFQSVEISIKVYEMKCRSIVGYDEL